MTDQPFTFTWEHQGLREQVRWIDDVDEWTAAELRQCDALTGGNIGGSSVAAMRGLMMAVSIARHFGLRVSQVDAEMTVRDINRCRDELQAQLDERAAAAEDAAVTEPAPEQAAAGTGRDVHVTGVGHVAAVGTDAPAADDGEDVLSPTKPGGDAK